MGGDTTPDGDRVWGPGPEAPFTHPALSEGGPRPSPGTLRKHKNRALEACPLPSCLILSLCCFPVHKDRGGADSTLVLNLRPFLLGPGSPALRPRSGGSRPCGSHAQNAYCSRVLFNTQT